MNDEVNESEVSIESDSHGEDWSIDNPLPVQIVEPSSSSESTGEEEITIRYYNELGEEDSVIVEDIQPYINNSRSSSVADFKNLWKLKVGNTVYDVLFPEQASLSVVDGKLYNTGSSNITGLIIDSSFSDSSYSHYSITVLPVSSSSTQTQVYRNGSRIYLTSYSTGQNYNLVTTVQYIQPTVEARPAGWSLAPKDWIICGLLLLSILISVLGGVFRR